MTPDGDERDEDGNNRPQRSCGPPIWLTYSQQTYPNDEEWKRMETSFNILTNEIDKKNVDEYNERSANMIARMIAE